MNVDLPSQETNSTDDDTADGRKTQPTPYYLQGLYSKSDIDLYAINVFTIVFKVFLFNFICWYNSIVQLVVSNAAPFCRAAIVIIPVLSHHSSGASLFNRLFIIIISYYCKVIYAYNVLIISVAILLFPGDFPNLILYFASFTPSKSSFSSTSTSIFHIFVVPIAAASLSVFTFQNLFRLFLFHNLIF